MEQVSQCWDEFVESTDEDGMVLSHVVLDKAPLEWLVQQVNQREDEQEAPKGVHFYVCEIAEDAGEALREFLCCLPRLADLRFSRCSIGDEAMQHLSLAIHEHGNSITTLSFDSCDLDEDKLVCLVRFAYRQKKGLESLNLSFNPRLKCASLTTLDSLIRSQENLLHLHLCGNRRLMNSGWRLEPFLESVRSHRTLEELFLVNVRLNSQAAWLLFSALMGKPRLKTLVLSDNPLRDGPWLKLLAGNHSLRTLVLPPFHICMTHMINAIGRNTSLVRLQCDPKRSKFAYMICHRNKRLQRAASSKAEKVPRAVWPIFMTNIFGRGGGMNMEVVYTLVQDTHTFWIPSFQSV